MREPTTRGPAVELDELEKRLRSGAKPAQTAPQAKPNIPAINVSAASARVERPDPLTELARLMPATQSESERSPLAPPYVAPQSPVRQNTFSDATPRRPEQAPRPAPGAPMAPAPSSGSQQPSFPSAPPLPPLPTLPPLPPLPNRDPKLQRELQPPTFTPPAPPPPAYNRPDLGLRGTLPSRTPDNVGVPDDYKSSPRPSVAASSDWNKQDSRHSEDVRMSAPRAPDVQSEPGQHGAQAYETEFHGRDYAPEITAVDPQRHAHEQSGYYADAYPDDTAGDWTQNSPEGLGRTSGQYETAYDPYGESYEGEENDGATVDQESWSADELRRKLRPWHAVAAIAALAIVSIGWSFLHRAGMGGSREIATIAAPEGPMKVKPVLEPESDAPTAGAAAVLDRNEPESVKKVVKNLEQAVDPSVAPQQNGSIVPDAAPPAEIPGTVQLGAGRVDAPHEPPPAGGAQQPRKVKSIAVPATPVAPPTAPAPGPAAAPQPVAPTTAKTASGAKFIAQFATANSEAEARTIIKNLSSKYGGSLAGGKFTFKPVKTGPKTIYLVRAAGMTREAADALCARATGKGDSCAAIGN